ncbi:MAG: hypothetical protein ABR501_04735, partial [Pyrinomonadaceae bacterium]
MKLCPHCDFIYEDDQTLCDMDGRELVYRPGPGANDAVSSSTLSQRQENPWAAESLTVSDTTAPAAVSKKGVDPKPEKKSVKKSKKKSTGTLNRKRGAVIAAAFVVGIMIFMGVYVSSRPGASQLEAQGSNGASPSIISAAPGNGTATDSTAAVGASAQEVALKASQNAAAPSDEAADNLDKSTGTNTGASSSNTGNAKVPSAAPPPSAPSNRELAANNPKPENISAPKDTGAVNHEPVSAPKETTP